MLKICPRCHRTFSGGRLCLDCEGVALLDVADRRSQPHLRQAELQHTINTYYGARSAMLLLFASILLGGIGSLLLARHGVVEPGREAWSWFLAAGLALVGTPVAGLLGGVWLVRRLGVCRGSPPTLDDLRASLRARKTDSRA